MRYPFVLRIVLAIAIVAIVSLPARAEDPPNRATENPATLDVGDLWRLARHKNQPPGDQGESPSSGRFFVAAPSVGSKPSTGLNAGLAGNVAFFAGAPQRT